MCETDALGRKETEKQEAVAAANSAGTDQITSLKGKEQPCQDLWVQDPSRAQQGQIGLWESLQLLRKALSPCWKMDGPETDFNLKVVLVSFKQCLTEEGEVLLDHYIASWKGLVRFLNSLGAVFSFISKDVVSKLQIMEHLRKSPQYEHYTSLQSMVAYEVGNKLVDIDRSSRSRYPNSGCRTVLRLHRALHWLRLFLEGLRTSPEDARTSTLCSDAYNATLAAYHSWIIRQAVTVAFCALPTRKVFLEAMNVGSSEQAVEMLGEALPFIEHVYDISQKLYAEHSLLDLP